MNIILSDKELNIEEFGSDVIVKRISYKTLDEYKNNADVVAIAGSRAMAIKAVNMNFPSLKLFQLTSAGFDGVPNERYASKGILVANAGSVYSAPIAETVVFGILSVAKKLHKTSMSAQAVGNAVAHNPISIIIPCHRVVGKNGSLTGYAGGIDKKIKLLEIENVKMEKFSIPKIKK